MLLASSFVSFSFLSQDGNELILEHFNEQECQQVLRYVREKQSVELIKVRRYDEVEEDTNM